jgi:hypothetical protein
MSDATNTTVDTPDYLSMSDAEIMAAAAPVIAPAAADATPVVADAKDEGDGTTNTNEGEGAPEGAAAADDAGAKPAGEDDEGAEGEGEGGEKTPAAAKDTPAKTGDEKPADKADDAVAVDFEAEYKRLLAPFKANGREISVGSVDDAIVLMQMGANYNKKMAALKPNLKLMKLLENNGLMSEEKLSFLIEVDKKNPDAINKLVKDSGLNPMDFDAEKAGEYKPKIHTVDDREMDLDTVLEEIQETPTYTRTLEIVSKKWDGNSKQVIAETPQLLKVINEHVERGIYDIIHAEVEKQRVFGRLNGLSDLEAYRQVGDAIQARGGFDHLGSSQGKPATKPLVVTPKPKKVDDAALNDKRRAASSTKPATPAPAAAADFNPLALSDEEFAKVASGKFR